MYIHFSIVYNLSLYIYIFHFSIVYNVCIIYKFIIHIYYINYTIYTQYA